ncbi:hypothetical protein AEP_01791 [Curvibacter sp. AEP1-3]|uniref:hypothetical protein n=1 Tax=Curvibacter sp. AEP1-3 TaxID=1844971 RepID=UPI000B3CB354|nr:hypothetical protein [Curvibacter sp. AEP1-3]ARV18735.1 hypothetical protein AEP_01791 [Curvibacter sp. AEP1-3]
MSFARIPPNSPAPPRSRDAAHEHPGVEQTLSANAEAWRRLAIVGYHRASELVRARQPASAPHDPADGHEAPSSDPHQSGFQNL